MLLKYRSRRLSPLPSSFFKLPYYTHVTVCFFFLIFIKMVFMTKIGERRICVISLALPTTTNLSEVFASADQVAIATFLTNKAVERSLTNKLEDSRDYVFQRLVKLLVSYKTSMTSSGTGASAQLAISDNLKMLPVLVLGLLKNVSFCDARLGVYMANPFPGWNSTKCTDPSRYPDLL